MSDSWATVANAQDSEDEEYQPETAGESHLLLLWKKKYCDVIFTFPNLPDRIAAHEVYLKARSPVFAKIFRMRKSGNVQGKEIEISESTPKIFQLFLEFIYADRLDVDIAGALALLQLSHKYKVQPLLKKCEEIPQTEISPMDSVNAFEAARRCGRRELMDRAGHVMVKSFYELLKTGALSNAEEETIAYLLENDNLAVEEVKLFQFVLDWGRKQVGASTQEELLRTILKNLLSKIRYTNMAPDDFTKVVAPTGLLSPEETISIFSYFCADDVTRKGLQMKFNTTCRKMENLDTVTNVVGLFGNQKVHEGQFPDYSQSCRDEIPSCRRDLPARMSNTGRKGESTKSIARLLYFYSREEPRESWFPAFSNQCVSFQAGRTSVDGKLLYKSKYLLKKTAITEIHFVWPRVNSQFREGHVASFIVSILEYTGPVKEGNLKIRFETKIWNSKQVCEDSVAVQPPVELISGRTYSIIFEDFSTVSVDSFRKDPQAYWGFGIPYMKRLNVYLEDLRMSLEEITRNTEFYAKKLPDRADEIALILGIRIELL